jgi:heat shock protein HslJ
MNPIKALFLLSLGLASLTLGGCQSTGPSSAGKPTTKEIFAQLPGKTWKLDRWTDAEGHSQATGAITLAVSDNQRMSGSAGVNRYTGGVKFTDDGRLDFSGEFATTMMMGPPEAMTRERRYLSELKQVRDASLDSGRLILTGDGTLRLEFVPAPPSP